MDVAASEFFIEGKYDLDFKSPPNAARNISADELASIYQGFINNYPGVWGDVCESVGQILTQKWVKYMSEICVIMWTNEIHHGPLKEQFTPKPKIHIFPLSSRNMYPHRMLYRLPLFIGFLPGTQFSCISPDLWQPFTLNPLLVIITCFCDCTFQEMPLIKECLFNTSDFKEKGLQNPVIM